MADRVGAEHGGNHHLGCDGERLVVDGLALGAGGLGDRGESVGVSVDADVTERDRQADVQAEVDDLVNELLRAAFQDEQGDDAEGDLLAVPVGMGLVQHGQAVVDGVRCRQTAGLEAQPGEQRVVAEPREDESGLQRRPAGHRRLAGRRGSDGFEVRRQSVADPGHEQADGSVGDHLGVNEHRVRVAAEEAVLQERAVIVVDDRQGARGRVGGRDRRHDDQREPRRVSGGLGGVKRLAATDGHDRVGPHVPRRVADSLDLAG